MTITGGEPLLNPAPLLTAVKEAGNQGIIVSLNTNLTVVSENFLRKLKDSGVRRILTSLVSFDHQTHDGITQRRGSFRETLLGIRAAQQVGFEVIVNMVVSKLNLNQVYQTGVFCYRELGVKHFCATKASPSLYNQSWIREYGLTPFDLKNMLESLRRLKEDWGIEIDTLEPIPHCFFENPEQFYPLSKRRCVAALTTCTIGAGGEIRPCSHTEKSYGNIFKEGLENAWGKMAQWRTGELIPYKCKDCEELATCGGGCRVSAAYTHNGDYSAEDPFMIKPPLVARRLFPKRKSPELASSRLRLIPSLRTRKEEFGGIIDNSSGRSLLVNERSFVLIGKLRGKTFSLAELSQQEEVSLEELSHFFSYLWENNFIEEVKG